jgi:succinate dehydrogenase / fumarate reductase cytochrome b subunit
MAGKDDQARSGQSADRKTTTAQELKGAIDAGRTGVVTALGAKLKSSRLDFAQTETRRIRPLSPNIQIYQPQLTSVLSIINRITGLLVSLAAVGLVAWLLAAAAGPQAYAAMQRAISSWTGQVVLVCFTFAFFLHFCGGIRHLVWDTVHGFELRSIYISGWMVVAASILLTAGTWIASSFMAG